MAINFYMPQLGLTMEEGEVTKWFKSVGESVKAGEVLVEIATDKITNQIESPADGVILSIEVQEGTSAPVKALLAVIGEPGEKVEAASGVKEEQAAVVQETKPEAPIIPVQKATREGDRIFASPAAKKLAKEKGVDLSLVTGTGPGGRIVERDVLSYKEQEKTVKMSPLAAKLAMEHGITPAELAEIDKETRIMKDDVLALTGQSVAQVQAPVKAPTPAAPTVASDQKGKPLSGMRKVISERMSASWHTYPRVTMDMEVDMSEAKVLRSKLMEAAGTKFSYTEIIVKACALALMEYKVINSSLINNLIYEHESANIGVAVALDNGLIVPVIKDAQNKSIRTLRQEIGELSERARSGGLGPDKLSGGTFTISNMGMYGVTHFSPIINSPETAILGVCSMIDKPVVVNGEIAIRPMMNLCLTFDHRLVDGSVAAQFLGRIRKLLEQPYLLF